MTKTSDVVIAGAGVIGLATAWYLRAAGASVTLLETGSAGRQASWAGGGILWPIYPWRYPAAVRALAERGAAAYPCWCQQLIAASGIDPQWRRSGAIIVDPEEHPAAIEWARASGWTYESLTPELLGQRYPALAAHAGGVVLPQVSQVRNPRLCQALVAGLRQRGVAILENSPAQALHTRDGRFAGFHTADGIVAAGAGVIAAGAWSSALAAGAWPQIRPVKGQMLLLAGRPGIVPHIVVHKGRYAIPRADGRVLIGSTVEEAGFNAAPTADGRAELLAAAARISPALAGLRVEAHWAGLRPATSDGQPFVGPVLELSGLFANIGHYRNGLVNAPSAAQIISAAILGTTAAS